MIRDESGIAPLKWAGMALGGLVGVIVIVLVILYFVGGARINKTYDINVASVAVSNEAGAIERGRHLVEAVALCQECHGENLAGDVLEDSFLFGEIMPSNLTVYDAMRPRSSRLIEFTATEAGEYRYFCRVLGHDAMKGMLLVR